MTTFWLRVGAIGKTSINSIWPRSTKSRRMLCAHAQEALGGGIRRRRIRSQEASTNVPAHAILGSCVCGGGVGSARAPADKAAARSQPIAPLPRWDRSRPRMSALATSRPRRRGRNPRHGPRFSRLATISRERPDGSADASEQLGVTWPYWCESALRRYRYEFPLSTDLRRQRTSEADMQDPSRRQRHWSGGLYAAMIELVQHCGRQRRPEELDDLRAGFEMASTLFDLPCDEVNQEVRRGASTSRCRTCSWRSHHSRVAGKTGKGAAIR